MFKRSMLRSPKFAKRRRRVFFVKALAVLISLSAIIASLSYISHNEIFTINAVSIEGNSVVTEDDLLSIVNDRISGKYFRLFPKSNIVLYPRKSIEAAILESFKKIDKASVKFQNLQSILLSVHEREPYALWCEMIDGVEEEKVEECYFLDKGGFIFTRAPDFTGSVYFRFYGLIEGVKAGENPIGGLFLGPAEFQKINFFLSSLRGIGIDTVKLSLNDEDDFEIYLESGGVILFSKNQDITRVFDNIQSVFESDEFKKKNLLKLDYADFRFGSKVYFKFE